MPPKKRTKKTLQVTLSREGLRLPHGYAIVKRKTKPAKKKAAKRRK